jgi:hypothetical protein
MNGMYDLPKDLAKNGGGSKIPTTSLCKNEIKKVSLKTFCESL